MEQSEIERIDERIANGMSERGACVDNKTRKAYRAAKERARIVPQACILEKTVLDFETEDEKAEWLEKEGFRTIQARERYFPFQVWKAMIAAFHPAFSPAVTKITCTPAEYAKGVSKLESEIDSEPEEA